MLGRRALVGIAVGFVAVGASAAVLLRPSEGDLAIGLYSKADCIPPRHGPAGRTWDTTLPLPGGASVNVSAEDFVGGLVVVRFSDGASRHITTLRDYVYPHDLRIARDTQTLWILNSGLAAGAWREAHLYEYNLASRTLVRDLDVDPDHLPAPCAITAGE